MNVKKSLAQLIALSLFLTGCSAYKVVDNRTTLASEATKQQTMTKVQNDNSALINKNYEYVLENLGEPNVTTYWTAKDKNLNIEKFKTIEELEDIANIDLLYMKNVSTEGEDNSALCIRLKDNVVTEVQSVDYIRQGLLEEFYRDKIIIDYYSDYNILSWNEIKTKNLDSYEGKRYSKSAEIVGESQCVYGAYYYKDNIEKSVEVYALDSDAKILCIFTESDIISSVELIDYEDIESKAGEVFLQIGN